jgi:two-component system chemotaxis response regulator CheY
MNTDTSEIPVIGTPGPQPEAAWPHRCDVLIVDDTGASRELLAAILRSFGGNLKLHECRNGTEALAQWPQLNPRITLLDIDMPGMDGLAVLKSIRFQRADAFVAMVSAGSAIQNVRTALSLGASGYVVKPYKSQRILDLVHKYRSVSGVDIFKP